MKITRKSILSGTIRTLDIYVTEEQMEAWRSGELIQKAMPHLSDDDREFIMTGITPDEWDNMMEEEE